MEEIQGELEAIRRNGDGVLRPEAVVDFARNPKSKLHDYFEWDDSRAAQEHRLWQARALIKTVVTIRQEVADPVDVYVSLLSDRKQPGGGYRLLVDVLADPEKRNELLQQALAELQRFREKYAQLQELSKAFKAIDKVLEKNGHALPKVVRRKQKPQPEAVMNA